MHIRAKNINFSIIPVVSILLVNFLISSCATKTDHIRLYPGSIIKPNSEIARIIIPNELEVLEVDGQEIEIPYKPGKSYRIDLLPGEHFFAVIYQEFWGNNTDGAFTKSKLFRFKHSMQAGEMFKLKHNAPEDLSNAESEMSVSEIKIWLQQAGSSKIIQAYNKGEKNNYLNLMLGKVVTEQGSTEKDPFEQLKYWWKMADDKQRQLFRDWVAKRSIKGRGLTP